jgi:aminopeptidase N
MIFIFKILKINYFIRLNEGFATYLMYVITDELYPDWHMNEFYSRNILMSYAFVTDASEDTRAMSSELITMNDINNSFDDIAYDKASCVLRMFHHVLGDELFKQGLKKYIEDK